MPTTIIELLTGSEPTPTVPEPSPTGELVHNPNMVALAIRRLISWYRKPRNKALLSGAVGQTQELEDSAWSLYYAMRLENAVGVNLDVLGRRVGEKRAGRADEDYRAAIRTRIIVNLSNGHIEDMIAVVRSLLPNTPIPITEYYPKAISFVIEDLGTLSFRTIYGMLMQAKPAGTRLEFTSGPGTLGAEDDSPLGGTMGSEDDNPLGFTMASGT